MWGDGGSFGTQAEIAWDFNGNGSVDLLVTESRYEDGSSFSIPGRTLIFEDPPSSGTMEVADATVDLYGDGSGCSDCAYAGASGIGDINGDSYDDLLILVSDVPPEGRGYLFYGPISPDLGSNTEADATIDGDEAGRLGSGGAKYDAGDVDADGFSDFLVPKYARIGTSETTVVSVFKGAPGP